MREKTLKINVRENRSGNQELIIQRNWQHRAHKTQDEDTKKHKQRKYDSRLLINNSR